MQQDAEMIEGPWDGHVIRAGQPGQRLCFPSRPDCITNGRVLAVYVMRGGAWRFIGWMLTPEESCEAKA